MRKQRYRSWSVINVETGEVNSLGSLISSDIENIEVRNAKTGDIYKIDIGSEMALDEGFLLHFWQENN